MSRDSGDVPCIHSRDFPGKSASRIQLQPRPLSGLRRESLWLPPPHKGCLGPPDVPHRPPWIMVASDSHYHFHFLPGLLPGSPKVPFPEIAKHPGGRARPWMPRPFPNDLILAWHTKVVQGGLLNPPGSLPVQDRA